jgi:predicted nucleic acid-binding protein
VKLRIYLDTSVFSAFLDERDALRQRETQELFARLEEYEANAEVLRL